MFPGAVRKLVAGMEYATAVLKPRDVQRGYIGSLDEE